MREQESRKRPMRKWEVFLLLLALAVLAYFVLAHFGYDPVNVSEESQILEDPHR